MGQTGRYRSTAWFYDGASSWGPTKDALALHPTPKNLHMFEDVIKDTTARKGVVLDGFGGSGSTLFACENI